MAEFLTSTLFTILIFPIVSVLIGVMVKFVTQNDRYAKFRKEDIAVGLDLLLVAALTLVVLTTETAMKLVDIHKKTAQIMSATPDDGDTLKQLLLKAGELSNELAISGYLILAIFLGLWSISTIVRKWGWHSAVELKPVVGIALPLTFGVLALIVIMARVTS